MFAFCPHQLPLLAMPVSCFDVLVLILSTAVYACSFHFTMTAPLWNYRILRVLFYSLWFPLGIGIGEEHVGGLIGMCFECVSYTNSLTNLLTTIPHGCVELIVMLDVELWCEQKRTRKGHEKKIKKNVGKSGSRSEISSKNGDSYGVFSEGICERRAFKLQSTFCAP